MVLKKPNPKGTDPALGLHYSVYLMEEAFKMMPRGVEKICLLTDYREMISDTPISISKQWINILSEHYPEVNSIYIYWFIVSGARSINLTLLHFKMNCKSETRACLHDQSVMVHLGLL